MVDDRDSDPKGAVGDVGAESDPELGGLDNSVLTSEITIETGAADGVEVDLFDDSAVDASGDLVAEDTGVLARPTPADSAPVLSEDDVIEDIVDLEAAERTVLVVEDDDELRHLIVRLLAGKGIAVAESSRGLEALTRVRELPPDLIVLDAKLPEVHGFDVAQKLKQAERYNHIPIVMMSEVYRGWRIARDLREAYGIEAFLEKPFKLTELWEVVERLLTRRAGPRGQVSASAERLAMQGMESFQQGDLDGAIAAHREALVIDPHAAKLHFQLGVLFLKKKGLVYEAIEKFEQAIALDPEHFMALRSLAILYQRKGFRNKAIDMWERAQYCCPDDDTRAQIREHLVRLITS